MAGRRILFSVFMVLSAWTVGAQDGYTIVNTVFIPDRYYVGDRVEMRVRLSVDEGTTVEAAREIPELPWIRFLETLIVHYQDGIEVRIVFIPFRPGTRSLPPLGFGEITLGDLKIYTSSIIQETGREFAGVKGQAVLPGTNLLIAGFVAVLLFGPVLLYGVFRWGRSAAAGIASIQRKRVPYRSLVATLDELDRRKGEVSHREFYIALSAALRTYLSSRTGVYFGHLTTRETAKELVGLLPPVTLRSELIRIAGNADRVKFAGLEVDHGERSEDSAKTRELAAAIERYYADTRAGAEPESGDEREAPRVDL